MKVNKRSLVLYTSMTILAATVAGIAYAAFSDKGNVLGSSFSVGSADIKILKEVVGGTVSENLTDEIAGPNFTNIGRNWQKDYLIKLYNNGTYKMALATHSDYETINDPDDLRSYIYAEIFEWNDTDSDGIFNETELGVSLGRKTIIKWKTEGFDLGSFDPGDIKSYVIRFTTETLPDSKQGTQGMYNFEFVSVEI